MLNRMGSLRSSLLLCALVMAGESRHVAGNAKANRVEVSIANLQFKPAQIKIHAGDTVVWINTDDRDHTVVANDGTFKSENIKSGQQFEFTFKLAGRFAYGCDYHPRMKAVVIVE